MGEGIPEERPAAAVGDAHDLEALFRSAGPELWRAIYGFAGGRRHLAEDVVAEAFARAIEHAGSIRDPLPWIYRTAFRLASRELKREKRPLPAIPDPVPGIDPVETHVILAALGHLSPNQRAAVLCTTKRASRPPRSRSCSGCRPRPSACTCSAGEGAWGR